MKPSYFNIILEDFPNKDSCLIYNTKTQALLEVEKDLGLLLKKNKGKQVILDDTEYYPLIEEGICVPDNDDEEENLKKWADEISYKRDSLNITFLVTSRCNFACDYCFEKSFDNFDMTMQTVDLSCDWIIKKARQRNVKSVNLFYYGGEPLLRKDIIALSSKKIKKGLDKESINFNFGIVTNGFLIDIDTTKLLSNYGLKYYRITLDGSEKWHDKRRVLKNGKGTFNTIIKNIYKLKDSGVDIYISGNYDKNTYKGIIELIEYIGNSELKNIIKRMYFAPLLDVNGEKNNVCLIEKGKASTDSSMYLAEISEIKEKMKSYGFSSSGEDGVNIMLCPFKIYDFDIVIAPDGVLYKCPVSLGMNKFSVGHISSLDLNDFNDKMVKNDAWRKCFPCVYLPMCYGGCPFKAYLNTGNIFEINCPRTYFDSVIYDLIANEYKKYKMELHLSSH